MARRRPTKSPTTRQAWCLNVLLDSGVNFIDTAVCCGTSEARIGRAISGRRKLIVRLPAGHARAPHVYTAANIGVEHSLRTMRTDYIDIVQFPDSLTHGAWEAER